jgi:hypothetical protein
MDIGTLQHAATKLHTHTVVFKQGSDEDFAARYGLMGQTTKAISRQTGLSESQVQYRLTKAGVKRSEFRNGTSKFAKRLLDAGLKMAGREVRNKIAPKFEALSEARLNQ